VQGGGLDGVQILGFTRVKYAIVKKRRKKKSKIAKR
jgi:hypothetical protein